MLYALAMSELTAGINLIDIGASGQLDKKWKPIESLVNLVAFDPNEEECSRLASLPSKLRSATYLPYAVGGEDEQATLFKTESIYCYTVCEPNTPWLDRFTFGDLFAVTGTEPIPVRRFGNIEELAGFDADVIKTDSQGLDLQILSNSGNLLERAFYVETETGFVENCLGETTYAQIDEFMRSQGFLLFDLGAHHRVPRRNRLANHRSGREQILWCESVWLKDYVWLAKQGKPLGLDRQKAIKSLTLCGLQQCHDFGYELACLFHELGWVSTEELQTLSRPSSWRLGTQIGSLPITAYGYFLRLFPSKMRKALADETDRVLNQPDLVKATLASWRQAPETTEPAEQSPAAMAEDPAKQDVA